MIVSYVLKLSIRNSRFNEFKETLKNFYNRHYYFIINFLFLYSYTFAVNLRCVPRDESFHFVRVFPIMIGNDTLENPLDQKSFN